MNYKVDELLHNNSFLCWKLFSSSEDETIWKELLAENPAMQKNIDKATQILKSVTLNNYKLTSDEKNDMLNVVKDRINKRKKYNRRRKFYWISGLSGAAAIALLLILNVFYLKEKTEEDIFAKVVKETIQNEKNILLILADNDVMTLEQNADIRYKADGNIVISTGDNETLTKQIEIEEIKLNKLVVPNGKRSFLTLEDGTKIWVNSASTLEFPAVFQSSKREIRVEGEIYIEVTKDKARPFYVNTKDLKIEVLGTRFNVSAYADEDVQSVVLVEGKVKVDYSMKKIELEPDQMLAIADGDVMTERVNVYNHICWKDGLLQYSEEPLINILTKLSRYYNIPVKYEEDIRNMKCDGKLILFDDIKDVMETIYSTNPIEYVIDEQTIYVKKRRS